MAMTNTRKMNKRVSRKRVNTTPSKIPAVLQKRCLQRWYSYRTYSHQQCCPANMNPSALQLL